MNRFPLTVRVLHMPCGVFEVVFDYHVKELYQETTSFEDTTVKLYSFPTLIDEQVGTLTIPAGFRTDFASVPSWAWSVVGPIGRYTVQSVVHDYLYFTGIFPRKEADEWFLASMRKAGVPRWRRYLMYWCVRAFGGKHFNRRRMSWGI